MPPSGQHHVASHRRGGRFMTTPNGRVMFIAAHPDDPDFLAGVTVARLAKEGQEVAYVILTNGNKGSGNRSVILEQLALIRAEEQRRVVHVLGVLSVEFLGYEDGELEDTRDLRRDVTREIRRWRPDLIITLNPHRTYNNSPGWHRDHRVTGRVVLDAVPSVWFGGAVTALLFSIGKDADRHVVDGGAELTGAGQRRAAHEGDADLAGLDLLGAGEPVGGALEPRYGRDALEHQAFLPASERLPAGRDPRQNLRIGLIAGLPQLLERLRRQAPFPSASA